MNNQQTVSRFPHYYGDIVRRHLVFAGIVVLLAALLDIELRSFYLVIGVFGALTFIVLAGLTSPVRRHVVVTDAFVSAIMFIFFEYFALDAFNHYNSFVNIVFLLRQVLSITFLTTLYFSTKTIREMNRGRRVTDTQ